MDSPKQDTIPEAPELLEVMEQKLRAPVPPTVAEILELVQATRKLLSPQFDFFGYCTNFLAQQGLTPSNLDRLDFEELCHVIPLD